MLHKKLGCSELVRIQLLFDFTDFIWLYIENELQLQVSIHDDFS